MPLLSRHRRYMGALIAGILGFLFLSNLIPDPLGRWEWRTTIIPEWSFTRKAHTVFRNLGEYVHDNFGFRASLPLLRQALREDLAAPDSRYSYVGRDGQYFWAKEKTPEQSSGALVRADSVQRFVAMIGEMERILGPMGTKIVVAIPPNTQSVEKEALPAWSDDLAYAHTELDLALRGLKREGVTAIDLRPVLRALPPPRFRLTDTHWNRRSSIVAFNAVMVAGGHPGWQVDPAAALGPAGEAPAGDLLKTMRMPPDIKDIEFPLRLDSRARGPRPDPALVHHNAHFAFKSVAYDYAPTGPRVLIMGDSFTFGLWPRLFVNSDVSVVGWMHASLKVLGSCDFNFDDVKRFKPDLLIYARTERFFPCFGDDWPAGLPEPAGFARVAGEAAGH